VPRRRRLLLRVDAFLARRLVECLVLHRADGADLRVAAAELALRVEQRVDVQARGRGLAGQRAEALDELLLQVVGQAVLRAEEDDAALGDWEGLVRLWCRRAWGVLLMARSLRSWSELGALIRSTSFAVWNSVPMTGVISTESRLSSEPEDFKYRVVALTVVVAVCTAWGCASVSVTVAMIGSIRDSVANLKL
jgi:hypothetical protein